MLSEKEAREIVKTELEHRTQVDKPLEAILRENFPEVYKETKILPGKVSDSIVGEGFVTRENIPLRVLVRTGRISTHDKARGTIPFKAEVSAGVHNYMHTWLKGVLGTAQYSLSGLSPSSLVIASENVKAFKLENVMRQYNAESTTTTSLYHHWKTTEEKGMSRFTYAGYLFDVHELTPNGKLPHLLHTPSTKDANDMTVAPDFLYENSIITPVEYERIKDASTKAFEVATTYLQDRNLVLVDTKLEHGTKANGEIVCIDEWFTPDSSRMWRTDSSGNILQDKNGKPISYSKEFARGFAHGNNEFTEAEIIKIGARYILAYQFLTGMTFEPDMRAKEERIAEALDLTLKQLVN